MNNTWREMGFIVKRKPKMHPKIVRVKKRLTKCIAKFKVNRQKLVQLHLRNRINYLVIKELKRKLAKGKNQKKNHQK